MEGGRGVLQGESGTLRRRQPALEVFSRLLQRRLVSREQVVHGPYHHDVGLHSDTGEPRAVGSLVAGGRELYGPAPPPREPCRLSRGPPAPPPPADAATPPS